MSGEATWQLTSPILTIGDTSSQGPFSVAMLDYLQRVSKKKYVFFVLDYLTPRNMNMEARNGGLGR